MTFANARKNTRGALEVVETNVMKYGRDTLGFVKLLSHLHCIGHTVLPAFSGKEAKQHADRIVHYTVVI